MEEGELQRALEAILFAAGEPVEVAYAVQDFSSIPAFYTIPPAGHDAGNGPQRH